MNSISLRRAAVSRLIPSVSFLKAAVSRLISSVSFLRAAVSRLIPSVSFLRAAVSRLIPSVSFLRAAVSRLISSVSFLMNSISLRRAAVSSCKAEISRLIPSVSLRRPAVSSCRPAVSRLSSSISFVSLSSVSFRFVFVAGLSPLLSACSIRANPSAIISAFSISVMLSRLRLCRMVSEISAAWTLLILEIISAAGDKVKGFFPKIGTWFPYIVSPTVLTALNGE